jgi:hypothetical protein
MLAPKFLKPKEREAYLKAKIIEADFNLTRNPSSLPQTPNNHAPKLHPLSSTHQSFFKVLHINFSNI